MIASMLPRVGGEPTKGASGIAEIKGDMVPRSTTASANGLTPQRREDFERIVVRILAIAAQCRDPKTQHELMELANDLVKLVEPDAP